MGVPHKLEQLALCPLLRPSSSLLLTGGIRGGQESAGASKFKTAKLAQRRIAVNADATKTYKLRLNKTGRKLARVLGTNKLRRLTTTFKSTTRDDADHKTTAKKTIRLKAPK